MKGHIVYGILRSSRKRFSCSKTPLYHLPANRVQRLHSGLHLHLPWQEDERFERNPFAKKQHYQFNVGLIVVVGFSNTTPHKIKLNIRNNDPSRNVTN